jgi:hypothetical protein
MRKNDLIKQLQAIKGNPEVVLWNGFVGDYMHIDNLVPSDLVKITKEYWIRSVLNEECIDRKDWNYQLPEQEVKELERRHKTEIQWELNEYVSEEDIANKRYKKKSVVFIQPKKRGVSTFDRVGTIEY